MVGDATVRRQPTGAVLRLAWYRLSCGLSQPGRVAQHAFQKRDLQPGHKKMRSTTEKRLIELPR